MPSFASTHLGILEYREEEVLLFPAGVPGFEDENRWLLVRKPEAAPAVFLQSLATGSLAFALLPMEKVVADYPLWLSEFDERMLGASSELSVFAVVCFEQEGATVNLLGPVVIHFARRRGVQAIREDATFSARHKLEGVCW